MSVPQEELKRVQESLAQVDGIRDLNDNPNPGNTKKGETRGGWWEDGRFYVDRISIGDSSEFCLELGYKVERWRCGHPTKTGSDCRRWAALRFIDEKWQTVQYCCRHLKNKAVYKVSLGKNGLYTRVFPTNMREKIARLMDQPEAKNVSAELAMLKMLLENFLEKQAKTLDEKTGESEIGSNTTMGVVAKVSSLIASLAKTQADIDKQKENMMDIRGILVLLDAAMGWMLKKFGRGEDQRNMLLEMLPDLPWPQGVARLTGSEGLIGVKGNLLLPKPRSQQSESEVTASWASLDEPCRPDIHEPRMNLRQQAEEEQSDALDPGNRDEPGPELTNRFEHVALDGKKRNISDW